MYFTNTQLDTFKELVNIGVGKAAALLNDMIAHPIKLSVPKIEVLRVADLAKLSLNKEKETSAIKLDFSGSFEGIAQLVFPMKSADNLVSLLTGEELDSNDLNSLKVGTLNEVGNILLNNVLGALSNMTSGKFHYNIPVYKENQTIEMLGAGSEDDEKIVLFSETSFEIKDLQIVGNILLLLELSTFENLKFQLDKLNEN